MERCYLFKSSTDGAAGAQHRIAEQRASIGACVNRGALLGYIHRHLRGCHIWSQVLSKTVTAAFDLLSCFLACDHHVALLHRTQQSLIRYKLVKTILYNVGAGAMLININAR